MLRVSPPTFAVQLSEREIEILRMFDERLSNREIADRLVLSVGTVKWYAQQIFNKLGVSDRKNAVDRAQTLGLLDERNDPARPVVHHNLPAQLTSFVGRQREIDEIKGLLNTTRLLTLTGPGGIGKTRLAIQIASEMVNRFADGVLLVSLSPVSDDTRVINVIADVLGVREIADEPILETVKAFLNYRHILLVVDNFEHLMPAGQIILKLLVSAPHLKIIVTSRQVLHVPGEQEYLVPPLHLPANATSESIDVLSDYEAVALFVQRAKAVRSDFALTSENAEAIVGICQRLDALPLALELAAARIKLFTPQVMVSRLDSTLTTLTSGFTDVITGRQQTLRSTLDWSYNLLNDHERLILKRLGVFKNGASLDAVDAICADLSPLDILNGLASLVDKSLIQQQEGIDGEPRFWMLQTICEYALEKLDTDGEADAIRDRHAHYFLEFALGREPEIFGEFRNEWLDQLEEEHGNIRAALNQFLSQNETTDALRLIGALGLFWVYRGHSVEGFRWARMIFPKTVDSPPAMRAKALILAGSRLAYQFGKYEQGFEMAEEAMRLARQANDDYYVALALGHLAVNRSQPGSEADALQFFRQAYELFGRVQSDVGMAWTLMAMGVLESELAHYAEAETLFHESLKLYRRLNSTWGIGNVTQRMGITAYYQGQYDRGAHLFKTILVSNQLHNAINNSLDAVFGIGLIMRAQGQQECAVRLFAAISNLLEHLGIQLGTPERYLYRSEITAAQVEMDQAVFQAKWAEGHEMSLDQAIYHALSDLPS